MTTMTSTARGIPARIAVDERLQSAMANRNRPPRVSALSASMTFGWRALLRIKHVPEQLFDVTVFPIMFVLMCTYLFGGAIAGSTGDYLQFLLPGILVQTVVWISMYTGSSLNDDISKGTFDRFRSLPIWYPAPLVGALLGDVARYLFASTVVLSLGLALGFRPEGGAVGVALAVALLVLFSFSMAWIWTVFGLLMRTPNAVMMSSMTILFPLTFTSNIFVDPSTMPGWLETVVSYNPIARLVTAERGLMAGDAAGADIGWVLLSCAVLVTIFGPLTMRLYRNKQ
jgi:ABC-2 type transport system permease protein